MTRIPVGATIAHAYRFAISDFLNLVKVIWLPALAGLALSFFIQGRALAMQDAVDAQQAALAGQMLIFLLPAYLALFLSLFMQMESVTRLALGLMPAVGVYYLQLGRPLWRLIGRNLLALLLVTGLAIAAAIVVAALGGAFRMVSGGQPGTGIGLSIIAVGLLIYGALIYAAVRLFFFLNPVVIAEEAGLKRSWALGRGNFWRIVGVEIAVLVPLFLLMMIFVFGLFGFPDLSQAGRGPEAVDQAMNAWEAGMHERTRDLWYIFFPVSFVFGTLMYGLLCGAQAHAYRAVTGGTED